MENNLLLNMDELLITLLKLIVMEDDCLINCMMLSVHVESHYFKTLKLSAIVQLDSTYKSEPMLKWD